MARHRAAVSQAEFTDTAFVVYEERRRNGTGPIQVAPGRGMGTYSWRRLAGPVGLLACQLMSTILVSL